jgi:chaperonin GroEL
MGQRRLARGRGRGGSSWEKKHRVEDALQATRAALEEGIVPGGGVALLQASSAVSISDNGASVDGSDDERTGAGLEGSVVVKEPLRQLAENKPFLALRTSFGLNASTNEIVDLVAAGVIDPAMVTRSALQNAASIAKNILTTEAIVAELPEKEGAAAGGGMPDMSGMM